MLIGACDFGLPKLSLMRKNSPDDEMSEVELSKLRESNSLSLSLCDGISSSTPVTVVCETLLHPETRRLPKPPSGRERERRGAPPSFKWRAAAVARRE